MPFNYQTACRIREFLTHTQQRCDVAMLAQETQQPIPLTVSGDAFYDATGVHADNEVVRSHIAYIANRLQVDVFQDTEDNLTLVPRYIVQKVGHQMTPSVDGTGSRRLTDGKDGLETLYWVRHQHDMLTSDDREFKNDWLGNHD